jgi:hypothetical protein
MKKGATGISRAEILDRTFSARVSTWMANSDAADSTDLCVKFDDQGVQGLELTAESIET